MSKTIKELYEQLKINDALELLSDYTNLSPASIKAIESAVEGEGELWCLNQDERNVLVDSLIEVQEPSKEYLQTRSMVEALDRLLKRLEPSCCYPDKQATGEESAWKSR